jgi:hypothetical protein
MGRNVDDESMSGRLGSWKDSTERPEETRKQAWEYDALQRARTLRARPSCPEIHLTDLLLKKAGQVPFGDISEFLES